MPLLQTLVHQTDGSLANPSIMTIAARCLIPFIQSIQPLVCDVSALPHNVMHLISILQSNDNENGTNGWQ